MITFFVDIYNSLVFKINDDEKTLNIFEKYFDRKFNHVFTDSEVNYIVNYCGKIDRKIDVPQNTRCVQAFLGAIYKIWKNNNTYYALAEGGQKKGSHFCERVGNAINIYIGEDEGEDIVFRVVRELIFRLLFKDGFVPMHSSASIAKNNDVSVFFGPRNAGKTVMLSAHLYNKKERPVATDVLMIKSVGNDFFCCGMPLKFSYDKRMTELFKIKEIEIEGNNEKVRIFNSQLDLLFGTKCVWNVLKVKNFYKVHFVKDMKMETDDKLNSTNDFSIYMDRWNFGDFLQLTPNANYDFSETYSKIKFLQTKGDFTKYV